MIKNLVFKGGGVLGIAYVGAIEALEERKMLLHVRQVAGTSAGAIIAALLSLKYSSKDILRVVQSTNFNLFADGKNLTQISPKYGLFRGNVFLRWMKKLISDKGLSVNATFADFEKAGMLNLQVYAADINSHTLKEFSAIKTPQVIVAEAIRASIAIPFFYEAWRFSNHIPDNHLYIDGGTICNFPINAFDLDDKTKNMETLGFYLQSISGTNLPSNLKNNNLVQFINDFFQTITDAQLIDFEKNPEEKIRTVIIDDFGISATDFNLSALQKQQLFLSGKKATIAYLNQNK